LVANVRNLRGMSPLITCWRVSLALGIYLRILRAITDCGLILLSGRVCGAESGMTPMRCLLYPKFTGHIS
jgi:hypothetical protein